MPTYREMAEEIIITPQGGVDENFKADEDFSFSNAVAETDQNGLGKWKGITVELYNFIIGEEQGGSGSFGNDDPQFVGLCMCPTPHVSATKEYKDLPEKVEKFWGKPFASYGPLNVKGRVRFGLITAAFNNDSSQAWEGIVKALGGDLSNVINQALTAGGLAVPGISQFGTPGAAAAALGTLVTDALTDEPEPMSGDVPLVDTVVPIHWYRKVNKDQWVARKFQVYKEPNGPGWYMTQWFITLSNEVKNYSYETIMAPYANMGLSHAFSRSRKSIAVDLAAVKVLGGQNAFEVAEEMNLNEMEISYAVDSLRSDPDAYATERILSAIAYHSKILT